MGAGVTAAAAAVGLAVAPEVLGRAKLALTGLQHFYEMAKYVR